MNNFHDQVELKSGYNPVVNAESEFNHVEKFGLLCLRNNESFEQVYPDYETALVVLSGTCTIRAGSAIWEDVGQRQDVFSGLPTAVYIPPNIKYSIVSKEAEVAVCCAGCRESNQPSTLILPDQIKIMQVGMDNWSREVRLMIPPKSIAKNMIIGETINYPGNWSGTPPHRHEIDRLPHESLHEEVYYFKTDKPQGWGIERLYSSERNINELIYLKNNTVTFMPFGNHQIVAGPGYTLYYLFFLAGVGNNLVGYEDPNHSWIKQEINK